MCRSLVTVGYRHTCRNLQRMGWSRRQQCRHGEWDRSQMRLSLPRGRTQQKLHRRSWHRYRFLERISKTCKTDQFSLPEHARTHNPPIITTDYYQTNLLTHYSNYIEEYHFKVKNNHQSALLAAIQLHKYFPLYSPYYCLHSLPFHPRPSHPYRKYVPLIILRKLSMLDASLVVDGRPGAAFVCSNWKGTLQTEGCGTDSRDTGKALETSSRELCKVFKKYGFPKR